MHEIIDYKNEDYHTEDERLNHNIYQLDDASKTQLITIDINNKQHNNQLLIPASQAKKTTQWQKNILVKCSM